MATVIMQKREGLTPDQYDALREIVGWDRDVPAGMRFHVASFGDGVLRMTDLWDSRNPKRAAPQLMSISGPVGSMCGSLQLRSASRSIMSRLPIADKGPAGHRPSYLHSDLGTGSAGGIGDAADCDPG